MKNKFTLKFTNLPFGIIAFNLREVINKTNAKICFIPCTKDRYACLRYVFLSFEIEDEMLKVVKGDNQYTIKGQYLIWTKPDTKTCHKCSSPARLIKNC